MIAIFVYYFSEIDGKITNMFEICSCDLYNEMNDTLVGFLCN